MALDKREHETYAHSLRVRAYTIYLARAIGYPPALLPSLEQAALLHDIGKLSVPDCVLLKPGKLTEEEWGEMRAHAPFGAQILERIPFLKSAALIVRHHHERYDGTGYPDRLRGDRIPIGSRIFAFADTLDAMTSDRPYRKAPGFSVVGEEIARHIGTQFDPHIASLFLKVPIEQWERLRDRVEEVEAAGEKAARSDPCPSAYGVSSNRMAQLYSHGLPEQQALPTSVWLRFRIPPYHLRARCRGAQGVPKRAPFFAQRPVKYFASFAGDRFASGAVVWKCA